MQRRPYGASRMAERRLLASRLHEVSHSLLRPQFWPESVDDLVGLAGESSVEKSRDLVLKLGIMAGEGSRQLSISSCFSRYVGGSLVWTPLCQSWWGLARCADAGG